MLLTTPKVAVVEHRALRHKARGELDSGGRSARQQSRRERLSSLRSTRLSQLPPAELTQLFAPGVNPQVFRCELEDEIQRHRRYLGGVGIVRLRCGSSGHTPLLRETLETETRRTDTFCALEDGSFALLLRELDEAGASAVCWRLEEVAEEIGEQEGEDVRLVFGSAVSGQRRVTGDELWFDATDAYKLALRLDY